MADNTPTTPDSPDRVPPVAVPDPHEGEALPPAQEGMRPEAAANAAVRPEQDEPNGPLGGLVTAASAQTAAEATPEGETPDAEAMLLENMGVEEEGIESGQLLGLVAAVIVAIVALAIVLIFLFYIPARQQAGATANGDVEYPELEQVRTEGRAKTSLYARADSSAYQIPVENAMSVIAARYRQGAAPAGLPATRQQWNTLMLNRGEGTTVQTPNGLQGEATVENQRLALESEGAAGSRAGVSQPVAPPVVGRTNEEVGVDGAPTLLPPTTVGGAQPDGE